MKDQEINTYKEIINSLKNIKLEDYSKQQVADRFIAYRY